MQTSATWAIAGLIAAAVGFGGSCLAGEKGSAANSASVLQGLAASAIPAAELGRQSARGIRNITVDTRNVSVDTNFTFDGALSNGALKGNAVIGTSDTGLISTANSINNNNGITTVFQNSGNNSLFQQSTSITITVH
ncbi:MAG: hypothetical protein AB7H71_03605 [Alphaproteobacteria bacterium]